MLESIIVGNGKTLRTEWEEVADHRAVILVPFASRYSDFFGDDRIELAPERKAWDGRDVSKRG